MKKASNQKHQHDKHHQHNKHHYILYIIYSLFFCMSISLSTLLFNVIPSTSALTYQNTIPQTFTINDTLSISLSSSDLRIDELVPGQSSDSNTITVTVYSNNAYGYNLSANTGNTTYNTTNLVGANNNNFSSLSTEDSKDTPSSFNDNTWGFNYCDYNNNASCNNNWKTYSGLPIYTAGTNKELKNTETVSASEGDKLDFKIAARASESQAGGEYNNVVNFIAVGYTEPQSIYMQDLDKVQAEIAKLQSGEDLEVVDKRDNKTYTVAKMPDGNIWMNQNLDLELDSSTPLTSEDTDLNTSGSGAYSSGYEKDPTTNVITWTPASTATTANHTINGTSVSNWSDNSTAPYSAEGGDVYVYTSGSTSDDTTYDSLAACKAALAEAECKHYHRGNYYNWTAAIASNASSGISSNYSTAANSVCPKGWRLPKGNENNNVYEFGTVLLNAGAIGSIPGIGSSVSYVNDGFNKIRSTPLYFVRSGNIYSSTLDNSASYGLYWSSTVFSSNDAYYLSFGSSGVIPRNSNNRNYGFSVRCLAPASPFMQEVDKIKAKLASAATGTELEVIDKRDNKTYTVAKLADGNIWMTQNLDFDIDSTKTYTSADTDIKADWKPSTSTTTGTSWSATNTAPVSYNPGDLCWKGTPSTSSYGSLSQYAQACSTAGSNKYYHVGNYYNWTAAVAMNNSSSYTAQNTDADQSICPAGWMLPKSGTNQTGSGSFQYLVNQQSLTSGPSGNIHTSPTYFVYGGDWFGRSTVVSYYGYYWSSVVGSSSGAYSMSFRANGSLYPQGNYDRNCGFSVRCVARPSA